MCTSPEFKKKHITAYVKANSDLITALKQSEMDFM